MKKLKSDGIRVIGKEMDDINRVMKRLGVMKGMYRDMGICHGFFVSVGQYSRGIELGILEGVGVGELGEEIIRYGIVLKGGEKETRSEEEMGVEEWLEEWEE